MTQTTKKGIALVDLTRPGATMVGIVSRPVGDVNSLLKNKEMAKILEPFKINMPDIKHVRSFGYKQLPDGCGVECTINEGMTTEYKFIASPNEVSNTEITEGKPFTTSKVEAIDTASGMNKVALAKVQNQISWLQMAEQELKQSLEILDQERPSAIKEEESAQVLYRLI